LRLADEESPDDVRIGCALIASRRAGLVGRAPTIHDLAATFLLWGFLGDAPDDLVTHRTAVFRSAAHEYSIQRSLVDAVPEESLRIAEGALPAAIREHGWRTLLGVGADS
jgi:hypothetical protein